MEGKIALEEHWAVEETMHEAPGAFWEEMGRRLGDIQGRLGQMDAHGIGYAILGLNSPAIQGVLDPAAAVELARRVNDRLAEEVARAPRRFGGFAGLPLQDPEAAAKELTRCVKELGFKGAMVNCFTQRHVEDSAIYYDLPEFRPFWATVSELGVPIYIHPRRGLRSRTQAYEGQSWLYSPVWDFGSETSTQALRLIGSGLFDEFPRLQIILGHLGERIPFDMWRIDNLLKKVPTKYPAKKPVSDYMRENFYVTTAGQFHDTAFHCALTALGPSRIMFSVDYPYEDMEEAASWFDNTRLSKANRQRIGRTNAMKLFKLKLG